MSVKFDPREFDGTMGALQQFTPPTLRNAGMAAALICARHTVKTKLIADNPPFLNRRTGTLVRSVSASPRSVLASDRVLASFGTRLGYGYRHEVGGTFTEIVHAHHVAPHVRRAHARKAPGGRRVWVSESRVDSYWVAQYSVVRVYRRRAMFATALEEKRDVAPAAVAASMRLLMEKGKVPTTGMIVKAVGANA